MLCWNVSDLRILSPFIPLTIPPAKLATSQFGNDEDINAMIDAFEQLAKPTFKDDRDRSYLKFGSIRDQDPAHGIRSGQLTLEGCMPQFL